MEQEGNYQEGSGKKTAQRMPLEKKLISQHNLKITSMPSAL